MRHTKRKETAAPAKAIVPKGTPPEVVVPKIVSAKYEFETLYINYDNGDVVGFENVTENQFQGLLRSEDPVFYIKTYLPDGEIVGHWK